MPRAVAYRGLFRTLVRQRFDETEDLGFVASPAHRGGAVGPPAVDTIPGDITTTETISVPCSRTSAVDTILDFDFFQVQLSAGVPYSFAPTGLGLANPIFGLYDSNGTLIRLDDYSGPGANAFIASFVAPATGAYFLGASGVATSTGTCELVTIGPSIADDLPGDTTTPQELQIDGPSGNGVIELGGDQDWFRVSLIAGESYASSDTIAYHYDNLNRECFKDWPSLVSDPTSCWTNVAGAGANDVFYEYDLAGRRKSVRFASTSGQGIVYGHDTAGRMSSEASYGRTLSFGYDLASNRERVTFPDNNFVQYTFDAMNRVDQVRLNNLTSGANLVADYGYDELSRRSSLARGAGSAVASSYGYDPASRLTTLAHDLLNTSADQTWSFGYTPASQLASRAAANDNYRWVGATIANRTYARNGLNQYTNVGGANFSYDARGNLTSDGSRTFAYDLENHLTSVNGAAFQLSYDPLGRLRQSVAGAATTEFLYDGDRLVAEYNGAGVLQRRYVHGPGVDEPLMWIEGASMSAGQRWLTADAQGSVVAATDASGALLGAPYAYGPYGEPDSVNLWSGSRFRYTGQIALPEANLYHYKARVYDPMLGRFLQTDPVGYQDDLNLYQYVGNDPLNRSDPTGELGLIGGAIGAVVGAAFETGRQLYINNGDWSRVDGNTIVAATVVGAAVGATAGLASGVVALTGATGLAATATVAIPTATVAATGSAVVTMIDNQAQGQPIPQNVLRNAAVSAVAAPVGEAGGSAATAAFSRSVTQGGGEVLRSSTVAVASAAAVAAEATTRTVQEAVAERPPPREDEIRR